MVELYARYTKLVHYQARNILGNAAFADEVVQETFLTIWMKAGSFDPEKGKARSWIMTLARNKVLDLIRSHKRGVTIASSDEYDILVEVAADQPTVSEQVIANIEGSDIREALKVLSPIQLEVVTLAYFHGLPQTEIAQQLGKPLGTVKTRMRDAIQKLREELSGSYDTVGLKPWKGGW